MLHRHVGRLSALQPPKASQGKVPDKQDSCSPERSGVRSPDSLGKLALDANVLKTPTSSRSFTINCYRKVLTLKRLQKRWGVAQFEPPNRPFCASHLLQQGANVAFNHAALQCCAVFTRSLLLKHTRRSLQSECKCVLLLFVSSRSHNAGVERQRNEGRTSKRREEEEETEI